MLLSNDSNEREKKEERKKQHNPRTKRAKQYGGTKVNRAQRSAIESSEENK